MWTTLYKLQGENLDKSGLKTLKEVPQLQQLLTLPSCPFTVTSSAAIPTKKKPSKEYSKGEVINETTNGFQPCLLDNYKWTSLLWTDKFNRVKGWKKDSKNVRSMNNQLTSHILNGFVYKYVISDAGICSC